MGVNKLIADLQSCISAMQPERLVLGLCTTSVAGGKRLNYFSSPRIADDGLMYVHLVLMSSEDAHQVIDKFGDVAHSFFVM